MNKTIDKPRWNLKIPAGFRYLFLSQPSMTQSMPSYHSNTWTICRDSTVMFDPVPPLSMGIFYNFLIKHDLLPLYSIDVPLPAVLRVRLNFL